MALRARPLWFSGLRLLTLQGFTATAAGAASWRSPGRSRVSTRALVGVPLALLLLVADYRRRSRRCKKATGHRYLRLNHHRATGMLIRTTCPDAAEAKVRRWAGSRALERNAERPRSAQAIQGPVQAWPIRRSRFIADLPNGRHTSDLEDSGGEARRRCWRHEELESRGEAADRERKSKPRARDGGVVSSSTTKPLNRQVMLLTR